MLEPADCLAGFGCKRPIHGSGRQAQLAQPPLDQKPCHRIEVERTLLFPCIVARGACDLFETGARSGGKDAARMCGDKGAITGRRVRPQRRDPIVLLGSTGAGIANLIEHLQGAARIFGMPPVGIPVQIVPKVPPPCVHPADPVPQGVICSRLRGGLFAAGVGLTAQLAHLFCVDKTSCLTALTLLPAADRSPRAATKDAIHPARAEAKLGQVSLNAAPLAAGQRQGGLGFFCAAGWIIENILQTGVGFTPEDSVGITL